MNHTPKASTLSMIEEMRRLREAELSTAGTDAPPTIELIRSCNRHDDCDRADRECRARGLICAEHCHDETWEDCFGK